MTMLLLEWVITSIFLILTVLVLRTAFGKRVSARLRYALWAVVLARLLVPVQLFTSPLVGMRFFSESRTEQTVTQWPITSDTHATPGPGDVLSPDLPGGEPLTDFPAAPQAPEPPTVPIVTPAAPAAPDLLKAPAFLGWIWLGGAVALALVLAASNLRFALRLRRSRVPLEGAECPLPVYVAAGLPSPCLFGLARPAVYVTSEAAADPAMLRHVITHEYTHFRQGDHLWSFLRCAALAAHWWNPLVWLAVKLSRRDGELACDEGALKRLGDGERLAYGNTLLALVTAKPNPGDLLCFATTMAGEKHSLKERVSRIACAPKRWLWAAVAVVLVTALACACAFSSAKEPDTADRPDAELPEYTLTYSMNWNGAVLVEGLDGAEVEWFGPVPCPSLGRLQFSDADFCCPSLADRNVFGHASWTDETRTVVGVTVNIFDDRLGPQKAGCLVIETPVGFFLHFSVELDSGTVLERNFQSYVEGETLELTDREMADMARILAKPLAGAEEYYQSHTGPSGGGELIETPIIEPPLFVDVGDPKMIIAEVLETTGESLILWDMEHTKVNCRLVYGYKASRYRYRVSEQGEFALYLTADALQQLGQAEMLLCWPIADREDGYTTNGVIPIADGRMVLEGEWRNIGAIDIINDQIQRLADKRARGEELSETEQTAPASPLETGMTVEEVIAFFDTWGIYWDRASADFSARRAELYGRAASD